MFARLGRQVYRRRWPIILAWAAVLVFALLFAPRVSSVLKAVGFAEEVSQSAQARRLLEQELGFRPAAIIVVFSSDEMTVGDARFFQEMEAALADLRLMPEVEEVMTYANSLDSSLVSADRRTTYVQVTLDRNPEDALDLMPEIHNRVKPTSLQAWVTGVTPIYADIVDTSEEDLRRAEIIVLPLVLMALLIIFGTAVAAGAPLVIGGLSVAATLALLYFLAQAMDISIFAMNMVTMLGLGIAIDYSLLLVSRFREELASRDVERAVTVTVATAGKAVFFSGATTFAGLMGLMLFKFPGLRSLGLGGGLVVLISVLAALSLLPALLGVLGARVNALRLVPRLGSGRGGLWHVLASWVMRHAVLVLVAVVALLLLLGSPFLRVELGTSGFLNLPAASASRQGLEVLDREFGAGELSPILVAVTAPERILEPESVGVLYDFSRELAQDPRVARVDSIVDAAPGFTKAQYQALYANPQALPPALREALDKVASPSTTLLRVVTRYPSNEREARGLVEDIRRMEPGGGLRAYVGGLSAELNDSISVLYRDFPLAVALVVVAIYLALVVLFRSVVLPLKAVAMNTLSILASYGALVFIFQQGHFSSLLNFTSSGFIESDIPVFIFFVLYGLSMDYEVFLLTRIKEVYEQTGDNTASVALGLERTGRIITSAALIMVLVTGSFATADIIYIKALGLGVAIAIFLDATVVRALLVPATMRLLGRWNWWAPGFLRRSLPSRPRPASVRDG